MRGEEELCPTNLRFPPNKSIVRIDPEETQDEPLYDISLEILKNNTIYNALTLTTEVPKYAAKGERKPTFGMPIPEAIMSSEIKELQVYVDYVTKYPQAQTVPKHGIGKGLMRKGDVPKLKNKKDVVPRRKRSIIVDENVLYDPDEAPEYATQKQNKASREQAILEEVKRKATGEGSGVTPESPDHSSSSDDSSESATNDKTKSERDSNHDESDNDFEHGDESDKSASDG
ncbi:hypothetical protein Tco_1492298 [Tanacetum coccineum]